MCHPRLRLAHSLFTALLLAASGQAANAQTCIGAATFEAGPVRIGAGADFTDGVKAYGVQLAFGSPRGAFATGGLFAVDYDDVDEGSTVVSVGGGYSVPVGASKKASFCPEIGFERQAGPNIDTGFGVIDISGRSFSFGGTLGGVVSSTPTMDFAPFVGAFFVMSKLTVDDGSTSASATEDFSVLTIGAGFVVNRTLTIRPVLSFPVGLEGGDASYGINFAFSFGSPPTAQLRSR